MAHLPLAPPYVDGLDREWQRLASPGTWWSGPERVDIAAVARAARADEPLPEVTLTEPAVAAATRISASPHVDASWLADLTRQGLGAEAYVELVAVVARVSAVDSFLFGVAATPRPLPEPLPGDPVPEYADGAGMHGGIAPTVGPAGAPNVVSAVPAEQEAMFDLHAVLYLSLAEMGDPAITKSLTRAQMELIAARTSLLNDCFY